MKNSTMKRGSIYLLLSCCVLLLLPYLVSMFLVFPIADDIGRANQALCMFDISSAIEEVHRAYMSWSGRFTHHFLVIFLGDAATRRLYYGSVLVVVALVYWISLFGIFNELQDKRERLSSFLLATVCVLAFLSMHQFLNMLYMMTNVLSITIGNGLILTFIWALCRLWNKTNFSVGMMLFVFCSGIAALGSYEHATIMAFLVAITAYVLARYLRHPNLHAFRSTAIVISIFCAVSFLAPGNYARNEMREVSLDQMLLQLRMALPVWTTLVASILQSPLIIIAIMLGISIPPSIQLKVQKRLHVQHIFAGSIILFVCVSLGIIVLHALSDQPIDASASKLTMSLTLLSIYVLTTMFIMLGSYVKEYTKGSL